MDKIKKIILAVAGSGKTTSIINKLNEENKILIITYTDNNRDNIRNKVIEKFKYFPANIKLYTYFEFLYRFCFAPYTKDEDIRGILFNLTKQKEITRFMKQDNFFYYFNKDTKKMYSNRLAKFCDLFLIEQIKNRIDRFFNMVFIDEFQDFAGNDFNFLMNFIKSDCDFLLYGDFYQHTFDTSKDGNINLNLYNDYGKFLQKIKKENKDIEIDDKILSKSLRCSKDVCEFITNEIGIKIESYSNKKSIVKEIINDNEINEIIKDKNIVKLFYKESNKYGISNKNNWGNCKGDTYSDVCVLLNKTTYNKFKDNKLNELAPSTKSKLYVACSRPTNNLYFIEEDRVKHFKISD